MNRTHAPGSGKDSVGIARRRTARGWPALLLFALMLRPLPAPADTVLGSKHDLSVKGGGTIKATAESEVCLFCHTPHRALKEGPLWNHALSTATYVPYGSSTAKAAVGQPTGSSRLCLSCHDGTVALGMIVSRADPIGMQGGVTTLPSGRSNLGTDLSDDHPVSFTYDNSLASRNGELKDPGTLTGKVRLDHTGKMQCTSCHNPHNNQYGRFLVTDNTASALCGACHDKRYWQDSTHRTSAATWNNVGQDPWPYSAYTSVAANGCGNCHANHGAATKPRLLVFPTEEQNCSACHSGNVASKNIMAQFSKGSIHAIAATSGTHDPAEDLLNSNRHVECVDCHNPHASKSASAVAPNASGALAGVAGISSARAVVDPITREYELCFRCHADSDNRGAARVPRVTVETNTRLEFDPNNASYHPIEAAGKNPTVPSLLSPWTSSSLMYCTDCHNNDSGPGAGGSGPRGPHGSANVPLLERNLTTTDGGNETTTAYALCYKCHSRSSLMSDASFPKHHAHVADVKAACTTCHDSHGVAGGTHLINFNSTYVKPSSGGRLQFIDGPGAGQGSCFLTCHEKDHNPLKYGF